MKKFAARLLTCVVLLSPFAAQAADLKSAFSSLLGGNGAAVSANGPGRFESAARQTFTAGGLEMRVPRTSTSLFSVTPASYSGGCGGISAHFGGFSFISGDQIEKLFSAIAQGAPGFAISMAIKTLCPQCESVIQAMNRLAQEASKMAIDSCAVSNRLASELADGYFDQPGGDDARKNFCGSIDTKTNGSAGWLDSMDNACKSALSSMRTVNGYLDEIQKTKGEAAGPSVAAEKVKTGSGNKTWEVLKAIFPGTDDASIKNRLMLLNVVGTQIETSKGGYCTTYSSDLSRLGSSSNGSSLSQSAVEATTGRQLLGSDKAIGPGAEADATSGSVPVYTCLPSLDEKEVMTLFLCGASKPDEGSISRAVSEYCSKAFTTTDPGKGGKIVWDCLDGYDNCLKMGPRYLADIGIVSNEGFVVQVNQLLRKAAEAVRNDTPVYSGPDGERILGLIQNTPYPIYQVINSAAVYPAAANELLDTMSLLVAENLAYAYFDQFMRLSMNEQFSLGGTLLSRAEVDRIQNALQAFRTLNVENRKLMAQNFAIQETISANIRQINAAVQRQVLTTDMLYQNRMAGAVSQSSSSLGQSDNAAP